MTSAMDTPTTRYLDRDGGRIAYDVTGDGPLVVAIPGMGDLRSNYRFLAPEIVHAGYRFASMDLRGHGDSEASFDAYDDRAAGSDLLALVGHLGGPAVIIGNSMGAGAAAWAAAEAPEAVRGLVLIGPFVRNAPVGLIKQLLFRLSMARPWGAAAWVAYLPKLYPGHPPADFERHRSEIRESLRKPGHAAAFLATTRTSHAPVEARLQEVHTPTLVVMGERDPDFVDPGAEANYVGAQLHGDVVMVKNAGHYPHTEYPEVVNPVITGFLARVTPPVT
ncbi:MAG TPA: alpha/beta hydrolase [Polyangiaceae bacterium]|nr:alpha/beta hydrolase [Polyangiaceae bacterium]